MMYNGVVHIFFIGEKERCKVSSRSLVAFDKFFVTVFTLGNLEKVQSGRIIFVLI